MKAMFQEARLRCCDEVAMLRAMLPVTAMFPVTATLPVKTTLLVAEILRSWEMWCVKATACEGDVSRGDGAKWYSNVTARS